jgi:Mg2+-importing ATPase
VLAVVVISIILPYTPLGPLLGFTPVPGLLLAAITALTLTYLWLVQIVKSWFYREHQLM